MECGEEARKYLSPGEFPLQLKLDHQVRPGLTNPTQQKGRKDGTNSATAITKVDKRDSRADNAVIHGPAMDGDLICV